MMIVSNFPVQLGRAQSGWTARNDDLMITTTTLRTISGWQQTHNQVLSVNKICQRLGGSITIIHDLCTFIHQIILKRPCRWCQANWF